jgi:hypothetical protein
MAILLNGPVPMAAWINSELARLDASDQMLMVPMSGIDSTQQLVECLSLLKGIQVNRGEGEIDVCSPGIIRLNSVRTVDDAIAELSAPRCSMYLMTAALNCIAEQPIAGKVVTVKTMMGQVALDREAFALALNLPLSSSEEELFTVFVPGIYCYAPGAQRMLVVVRGSAPVVKTAASVSLDGIFPLLEERAQSMFDTPAEFHIRDIANVWELFLHERFNDVLGLLRGGFAYRVRRRDDHLVMSCNFSCHWMWRSFHLSADDKKIQLNIVQSATQPTSRLNQRRY